MQDETLDALNELVEAVEDAGFEVTMLGVDEYKAGDRKAHEFMGADIDLTVFLDMRPDESDSDENPYRVK